MIHFFVKLHCLFVESALAVSYVPHEVSSNYQSQFTKLPELINIERFLILVIFLLLFKPMLRKINDPKRERERIQLLNLVTIASVLALLIRLFKLVSVR